MHSAHSGSICHLTQITICGRVCILAKQPDLCYTKEVIRMDGPRSIRDMADFGADREDTGRGDSKGFVRDSERVQTVE